MKQLKLYISIFILLLIGTVGHSQQTKIISTQASKIYLEFNFYEQVQQNDNYFQNEKGLKPTKYLNGTIPTKLAEDKKMFIFKSHFKISPGIKSEDLGVFVGTSNSPCVVYLNKKIIGRIGSFKESYTSQIHTSYAFYLSRDLLIKNDSAANELCLQYYPQFGEHMTLDRIFVSRYTYVSSFLFWRNLIGIHLVQAAVFFGLVLFLFYIYGFALMRDKTDFKYVYFSFFCLSFSMSYSNMTFLHDSISQLGLLRCSRFGLAVSNLMLIYLSMSFTGILNDKKKLKLLLTIPILLILAIVIPQPNVTRLDEAFSKFIPFVILPYMFLGLGIAIAGMLKKKTMPNLLFLVGFFILFILIVHDSVMFAIQYIPYSWLIPHGYAIFITFIFFILDTEQVNIFHLSENRAAELQLMKDELEQRVRERTFEIEQQKEEIEVQKNFLQDVNDNLSVMNFELHQKNEEITQQRDEIDFQKTEIEQKSKNITDSILYAKRIQQAIFPNREMLDAVFPEHFIFLKPKHVVSGDFYFFKIIQNKMFLAVADCTGHGVPGAFMSMLGVAVLNEIIQLHHIETAADALNLLREQIKVSLHQTGRKGEQQDGMDIALCMIDTQSLKMEFAGANNHVYLFRKGETISEPELIMIKGDRMPIGIHPQDHKIFTNHQIDLQIGDNLYLFSDGLISQFGGPRGDKFKTRRLQEMLRQVQNYTMHKQNHLIQKTLDDWQGHHKQVDDILLVGVNIGGKTIIKPELSN